MPRLCFQSTILFTHRARKTTRRTRSGGKIAQSGLRVSGAAGPPARRRGQRRRSLRSDTLSDGIAASRLVIPAQAKSGGWAKPCWTAALGRSPPRWLTALLPIRRRLAASRGCCSRHNAALARGFATEPRPPPIRPRRPNADHFFGCSFSGSLAGAWVAGAAPAGASPSVAGAGLGGLGAGSAMMRA
jgi:hypothetical protein